MKFKLLSLFTVLVIFANPAMASESEFQEIKDTVDKVEVLREIVKGPNDINYDCHACIKETEIQNALVLDSDEVSLSKVMFHLGKDDNTFVIKRDKNTPDKVTIKFDEKFRKCEKTVAFQNPLSGQIGFGCLFHSSKNREDSITIDLSDRPLQGDSEYIEVKLVKLASSNKGYINARFHDQTGKKISSDKGGKFLFFGTKYSLK